MIEIGTCHGADADNDGDLMVVVFLFTINLQQPYSVSFRLTTTILEYSVK